MPFAAPQISVQMSVEIGTDPELAAEAAYYWMSRGFDEVGFEVREQALEADRGERFVGYDQARRAAGQMLIRCGVETTTGERVGEYTNELWREVTRTARRLPVKAWLE